MLDRTIRTIEQHRMVSPGETVVLAVSGGADSMALLRLFAGLREPWRLRLHVAHLDHRLRPDSQEDAAFVSAQAQTLAISVTVEAADVCGLAAREKRSIEEAGRAARYAFFARVAGAIGAQRVATAHTRDDQVETVLMALLHRGPWEMLAGIPPARPLGGATVVRPLRAASRQEIVRFLRDAGAAWREDPTNRDLRLLRNRIRADVLPDLCRIWPEAPALLWELGEAAREADAAVARLAASRYGHLTRREDHTVHVARETFRSLPATLRRRLLAAAVAEVTGTVQPTPRVVLGQALRAAEAGRVGGEMAVGDAVVRVGYGTIEVAPAAAAAASGSYDLPVPGEVRAAGFGLTVTAELSGREAMEAPPGQDGAVFDADCVQAPLLIRSWRPGDRFAPSGLGGKKKVQDFFVDAKIPRWQRGRVALVVDAGDRILWVVGHRRAETCRVTERTNRVVRIRARPA